jgi:prepilin-type N-terminal cleavage/methylation domain-containing protein
MCKQRSGFTLTELLVVIAIIGMLVALLMPAIMGAREQARQATCLNNQKQIAIAIANYEAEKQHLPGFMNAPVKTLKVSWPMALLPYMGRSDMWETARSSGWNQVVGTRITDYVCPNDKDVSGSPGPLSYVVSDFYFLDRSEPASGFKFRDVVKNIDMSASKVKNSSQTVMLGECTGKRPAAADIPAKNRTWYVQGDDANANFSRWHYCFVWPKYPEGTAQQPANPVTAADPLLLSPSIFVGNHPQVVIVTFFDGHSEKVSDEAIVFTKAGGSIWTYPVFAPPEEK